MTVVWKSTAALTQDAAPFAIRAERASDVAAREALLDACFGENRHARTCQRLRGGRLVGTVRLWHVSAGGVPALVLGPLAVDASCRSLGLGAALMAHAIAAAKARGHGAVILLGDAAYYTRFGFTAVKTAELSLPGAFAQERLLARELRDGALDGAAGMIVATGHKARRIRARPAKPARPAAAAA